MERKRNAALPKASFKLCCSVVQKHNKLLLNYSLSLKIAQNTHSTSFNSLRGECNGKKEKGAERRKRRKGKNKLDKEMEDEENIKAQNNTSII